MSLKIQNITPAFVQSFRNENIKNITVDDIVAAKIHGVTAEFIEESEKNGYRFPSLEEYVDLKVRKRATRQ